MLAGVLMQHHAAHWLPRTPQPVGAAALAGHNQASLGQHRARPAIAAHHPVLTHRKLMEMPHVKPRIPLTVQLCNPRNLRIRLAALSRWRSGRTALRDTPNPAIAQPLHAAIIIPLPQPQKMPHAAPKHQRRLLATQPGFLKIFIYRPKTLHPYSLRQFPI